jgi:membrane fusion protein
VTVFIILLTILFEGHYTRRYHANGALAPELGLLPVTARVPATVLTLNVSEGQIVRKGTTLLTLSTERRDAGGAAVSQTMGSELHAQARQLEASVAENEALTAQRADALRAQRADLAQQIEQMQRQIGFQRENAAIYDELLQKIMPLAAKGYISAFQLQQQKSAAIDSQIQQRSLVRQQFDLSRQLRALDGDLAELPFTSKTKREEIERSLSQVHQQLAANEADGAAALVAPEDALVAAVLVNPGQAVGPGQSLLTLVPQASQLQARLFVASAASGFIRPGARVALRYKAFPFQKFGLAYGTVKAISHNAINPIDLGALYGGVPPTDPMFRVTVTLDRQNAVAYGRAEPLRPGMELEADFMLDRRRLIEWIFEPLYGAGKRWASTRMAYALAASVWLEKQPLRQEQRP